VSSCCTQILREAVQADEPVVQFDDLDDEAKSLVRNELMCSLQAKTQSGPLFDLLSSINNCAHACLSLTHTFRV